MKPIACPEKQNMVVPTASRKSDIARDTGNTGQHGAPRPATTRPQARPNPEPSHLQAIHASQHGVIIKGMHHETFWEWRV